MLLRCLRVRRDVQDVDRECHRVQTKLKTYLPFSNVTHMSLCLSQRQRQNREYHQIQTKLKNNDRHLNPGKTQTQNRLQIKKTLKCYLFETNQLMIGDVKKIFHFNIH